jgi:thiamine-phosphate diphosphorylase
MRDMTNGIGGLYVIIDPDACGGRNPVDIARLALEGASTLQWRDKQREKGDQLPDARAIRELCERHGATFIVNDHIDLALIVRADGVHLGQHDLPVAEARSITPDSFVIGASTNNVAEARAAEAAGAHYIAIGAVFPTASKEPQRTRAASIERVREVKSAVRVPVVAIGGIKATNAADVIDAGADAIAVISAVCGASDPSSAARELAALFVSP